MMETGSGKAPARIAARRSRLLLREMAAPTVTERRELAFAGVARQAEMVRSGLVTPRELVETALERIETLDPHLNAFRVVFAEQALREADAAGARGAGRAKRPLLGVPIAVKDDTPVAGTSRTRGSHAHGGPEPEDAEIVRRLRAAGAIVIGITRTPELAAWPFTETVAGGITRNPWDPQRTPGGSSGGSAAAVSAALVPGATASDGAGSIRIPAACCGLFGLKTSRGVVPTAPYEEFFGGLSVFGVLTRNVADAALLYEVVSGRPFIAAAQQPPPARLRIALATRIPPGSSARLDSEWRAAAEHTAELLRSLGHEVFEREPAIGPVGLNVVARYLAQIAAEADELEQPERLERRTRGLVRLGKIARSRGRARSPPRARRCRARQRDLRRRRRRARSDAREGGAADRSLRRSRRVVHAQRRAALDPLQRRLEPPRQPGRLGAGRLRRPRPAAVGAARRAPRCRRDAVLARARARARAAVGRRAPTRLLSDAQLLAIAEQAARAAGELLRERFESGHERATGSKSTPTDLVSEADLAAERAIREVIAARRPGDAILGEEGGETQEGAGLRWIVDPLDGTVNFLFGVPQWCVSVAVHDDDGGLAGVDLRPAARGALRRRARRRAADAQRRGAARIRPRRAGERARRDRLRVRRRRACRAGAKRSPACCRRCATCAGWAAPRSTSPGPRPGATTRTTSAACTSGTSRRERVLCEAAGLQRRALAARGDVPDGLLVAPGGLIGALAAIVA